MFASNLGGSEGLGGMACLFIDLSSYEFALQLMTHSVCGGETGKEIPLTVPPLHISMNTASVIAVRDCD